MPSERHENYFVDKGMFRREGAPTICFFGTPRVTPYSIERCPNDRGARLLLGGVPYKYKF